MANNKSNDFESDVVNHIFITTAFPTLAADLYISLCTGDPTDACDQRGLTSAPNECDYTGYARKAVTRNGTNWDLSSGGVAVTNLTVIQFDPCTGGTNQATHFVIGTTAGTGAGRALYHGELSGAGLAISDGITPEFAIGTLSISEL